MNSPARYRALEVLSRMRTEGLSMTKAARRAETSVKSIIKYVGSALKKNATGRYQAKPSDRLTRVINFYTDGGPVEITVKSSRAASVGDEWITDAADLDRLTLEFREAAGISSFQEMLHCCQMAADLRFTRSRKARHQTGQPPISERADCSRGPR